jgi:hypothetical protein
MTPLEWRFWRKVRFTSHGCWEWCGAIKKPSKRDFSTGGQSLEHGAAGFVQENVTLRSVVGTTGTPPLCGMLFAVFCFLQRSSRETNKPCK